MQFLKVNFESKAEIEQILKNVRGYKDTLRCFDKLQEVVALVSNKLCRHGRCPEGFVVTYTSGRDVLESYEHERWASQIDLMFNGVDWIILDIRSVKIPFEPLTYRVAPASREYKLLLNLMINNRQ